MISTHIINQDNNYHHNKELRTELQKTHRFMKETLIPIFNTSQYFKFLFSNFNNQYHIIIYGHDTGNFLFGKLKLHSIQNI